MKNLLIALLVLFVCGCTSLKPVELAPEQLQQRILSGEVVQVGDKVNIVTVDGLHHEFKVTAIKEDSIHGKDINIPIVDIIALETRQFSGGKTSALVGGTFAWLYIILLAIPAIVVL